MSPFRTGLVVGLALPLVLTAWAKISLGKALYDPSLNVEVVTHGDDVSRHGVARIVLSNDAGPAFEQICRGRCDDVRAQMSSQGDNDAGLALFDASGRKLASSYPTYVTTGVGTNVTRWSALGRDQLELRGTWISRGRRGAFQEQVFAPSAPTPAGTSTKP